MVFDNLFYDDHSLKEFEGCFVEKLFIDAAFHEKCPGNISDQVDKISIETILGAILLPIYHR